MKVVYLYDNGTWGADSHPVGYVGAVPPKLVKIIDLVQLEELQNKSCFSGPGVFTVPKGSYIIEGTIEFKDGTTAKVKFKQD